MWGYVINIFDLAIWNAICGMGKVVRHSSVCHKEVNMRKHSMKNMLLKVMFLLAFALTVQSVVGQAMQAVEFSGIIEQVKMRTSTLTVKTDDSPQVAFKVEAATRVIVNGRDASLADLKVGQKVRVLVEIGSGKVIYIEAMDDQSE